MIDGIADWPIIFLEIGDSEESAKFTLQAADYMAWSPDPNNDLNSFQACIMSFREDTNDLDRWLLGMAFFRAHISVYDMSDEIRRIGLIGGRVPAVAAKIIKASSSEVGSGFWLILVLILAFFVGIVVCCLSCFRAFCKEKKVYKAHNLSMVAPAPEVSPIK